MTLIVQMDKGCIVTVSMINGILWSHNVIKEIEIWSRRGKPPGFTCDYEFFLRYSYPPDVDVVLFFLFSSCNMKFLQKYFVLDNLK